MVTFFKYQGTGNDFILFGPEIDPDSLSPQILRHLCDRHFGIGADGVLCIAPSRRGVSMMRMFNPDGSEAEMCGNGIRCFAKHLSDFGLATGESLAIESKAGLHTCHLFFGEGGKVSEVEVDMGVPDFSRKAVGMSGEGEFIAQPIETEQLKARGTAVSMGNPHLVIFEKKDIPQARQLGPDFEQHPWFANRTNVEFVEQVDDQHLRLVVYERGAGITLACGTGACATVAAAVAEKRVDPAQPVRVDLPGGSLTIRLDPETGTVLMRGPAAHVFTGTISLKE